MNIILIGMMGSGKSTIGRILAQKLNWDFADSDARIEAGENKTIDAIFQENGEAYFRDLEKNIISLLCRKDKTVISTGGGAPLHEENWGHFKHNGSVVWLKSSPQNLFERLERNYHKRPLIKDNFSVEKIAGILAQREKFYQRANHTVELDGLSQEQVIQTILSFADIDQAVKTS